jgi:hypothetical protein
VEHPEVQGVQERVLGLGVVLLADEACVEAGLDLLGPQERELDGVKVLGSDETLVQGGFRRPEGGELAHVRQLDTKAGC